MAMRKPKIGSEERRIRVYRERNRILRSMGFADYHAYLKSDLWRSIRERVLAGSPACFACGQPATQAHHRSYRKPDLDGRQIDRIFPICGPCHRRIEFRDRDSEKLNPAQATAKMRQIRSMRGIESRPMADASVPVESRSLPGRPIDLAKVICRGGVHLGSDELAVGDMVRSADGTIGRIEAVRQANYLPQFRIAGRWVGKTRLRSKLVPASGPA